MTNGDGAHVPPEPDGGTEPPSGHALEAHDRRTLLALGIITAILILLVILGTVVRALS